MLKRWCTSGSPEAPARPKTQVWAGVRPKEKAEARRVRIGAITYPKAKQAIEERKVEEGQGQGQGDRRQAGGEIVEEPMDQGLVPAVPEEEESQTPYIYARRPRSVRPSATVHDNLR